MMHRVTATIDDMDPHEKLRLHFKISKLDLNAPDVDKEIMKANFMETVKEIFMATPPEDRAELKRKLMGLSKGVRNAALTLVKMKNQAAGRSKRKTKRKSKRR